MKKFDKLFPILKQYTYLNSAGSGLLSTAVMEWRQEHDLDFLIEGSILKERQGKLLSSVREKVGGLFGCAPNRVALVPNFSYGFNTLLEGISTPKKVLLIEQDYPSVKWPFSTRDFEVSTIDLSSDLEDVIDSAFAKAQPDIFAFSMVQWLRGLKIDQTFLKSLKAKYPGTLFFADGTQYMGTEVFDFDDSAIDALGASTYKWMNAGYGNAFFLFKEDIVSKVAPKTTGFNSVFGKYKQQDGSFIGRFEPGHQDTLNYGSLGKAIEVIKQIGLSNIQERIEDLSTKAKAAFIERDLLEEMIVNRQEHSAIFNIKGDERLVARLRENNVLCMLRGDGIRVSFQYFNTDGDLNNLLTVLDDRKK